MRHPLIILALLTISISVLAPFPHSARAQGDMNWLVPGLRVWYRGMQASPNGGQGGASAVNIERVYTIKDLGADGATVHVLATADHYSQIISDQEEVVPRPHEEGEFWINPARLEGLRPGDTLVWLGDEYEVSDRAVYTLEEFVNKYGLDYTPALEALFEAGGGRREVVALTGAIQGRAVYTFAFDVGTGLLIGTVAHDAYQHDATISLEVLAEINYDFVRREAFPEPEGPHANYFMELTYLDTAGNYVDLSVSVSGRHGDEILMYMILLVSVGGNTPYITMAALWSKDGAAYGKVLPQQTGAPPIDIGLGEAPARIGDHLPFYIGKDVGSDTINVWNVTMVNSGGEFSAQGSAPFYFQSISFDSEGYATQVTIYIRDLGAPIQLTSLNPGFEAQRQLYEERLGPAVPQEIQPTTTTATATATTTSTTSTTASTGTSTTSEAATAPATTSNTNEVIGPPPTQGSGASTAPGPSPEGGGAGVLPAVVGGVVGAAVGLAVVALLVRRR